MTIQAPSRPVEVTREQKIKVIALYIRKSRGDIDQDLEKHKSAMIAKCKHEGWKYVIYEEVLSGDSIAGRPVIQQLLMDVEAGMYDAVMGYAFDRIGRGGSGDQETILHTFRNTYTLYVTISPYKVYDFNDESDEQQAEFQGFMARFEYKQIKRRLTDGKRNGLFAGNFVYSLPPFGYVYNHKTKGLDVDEEKAKLVKEMVNLYLHEGNTAYEIAWEFNRRRIPSPKGGKWHSSTVSRMLVNKVYTGCVVGNKSKGASKKYREKHPLVRPLEKLPESEWIIVENCHTALISKEDQEAIKKIKDNNPKKRYKNKVRMFTGLIKCKRCGKNIPHKLPNSIVTCACGNRGGYVDIVQDAVLQTLTAIKHRLENVEVDDMMQQKERELQRRIDDLESKLVAEELAIERIEEAFEGGAYPLEKFRKKTKDREENILEIENKLSGLRKQMKTTDKDERLETISAIDKFLQDINEVEDSEAINALYKTVIREILWDKNDEATRASITVNFL